MAFYRSANHSFDLLSSPLGDDLWIFLHAIIGCREWPKLLESDHSYLRRKGRVEWNDLISMPRSRRIKIGIELSKFVKAVLLSCDKPAMELKDEESLGELQYRIFLSKDQTTAARMLRNELER